MAVLFSARARQNVRSYYTRISRNRLTTFFFLFGIIHAVTQGIMHAFTLRLDNKYRDVLEGIIRVADIPAANHTFFDEKSGEVVMCNWIPHDDSHCTVIFSLENTVAADNADSESRDPAYRGKVLLDDAHSLDVGADNGVTVRAGTQTIPLSSQCTQTLLHPTQRLQNSWREDLTLVLLQFWLFSISIFAMIKDSVPHVLAGLFTRILLTAWSSYSLWRIMVRDQSLFDSLIAKPGTECALDIFGDYFQGRLALAIPDIVLNVSALMISAYLSWTLQKVYNTQSFKCVGAPEHVMRLYKYFLAVQVCLQLEVFMLAAAMGLWIDQLYNSYIKEISLHTDAYEGLFISTTIILIPWIIMGWWAIRREKKLLMHCFIGLTFIFLVGWSVMFYSQVYRWAYVAWPMLGGYTTASMVLLVATFILAVKCRLNFNRGLAEYLRVEAALASSNFVPEVFEHDVEKSRPMSFYDISLRGPISGGGHTATYLPTLTSSGRDSLQSNTVVGSPGRDSLRRPSDASYKMPF